MPAPALRAVSDLQLPHVWRAPDLAAQTIIVPTGHAALDAQLPGGGWPLGSLVELLQDDAARHVWQLVLPGLVQALQRQPGPVVLVNAPFEPFLPSLQAQGLDASRLLKIQATKPQARLWAAEQALRCAEVAAVMAWLPQVKSMELRRLHLAAAQQERLLFVLRPTRALAESSPAQLRLRLEGVDEMQVHVAKRRGPPLAQPLQLPAYAQRVAATLKARQGRGAPPAVPVPQPKDRSHVLDRTVSHA